MTGGLGPNQHYGVQDGLEGQDSNEHRQKCHGSTSAVHLAVQTATPVVVRHLCLANLLVLSLQTIPSAFVLLILTQFPTSFGNGQLLPCCNACTVSGVWTSMTSTKCPICIQVHCPRFSLRSVAACCLLGGSLFLNWWLAFSKNPDSLTSLWAHHNLRLA